MKPGRHREAEPEAAVGTPHGVQTLAFLCGLVVAYLGFKSATQDFRQIRKLHQLDRYIETPGRFLQVKVRRDSLGAPDEFYPDVLYEYFVDGKSIWGWRLSYEDEPRTRKYWEDRLAKYSQGSAVPVYYDTRAPKEAILEKKYDSLYRIWMKLALGAGFLLAGVLLSVLPAAGWLRAVSVRK